MREYQKAALVWICYSILLLFFWAYHAQYNPFRDWLLFSIEVRGAAFYIPMYIYDFAVNIILAYPFALAFLRIPRKDRYFFAFGLTTITFTYTYHHIFETMNSALHFFDSAGTIVGAATVLLILPLAIWLAETQRKEPPTYNNGLQRTAASGLR